MLHRLAWSLVACAALSACLVDEDDRCGEHSVLEKDRCVCESGYGLVDDACVKCGKHEKGSLAGCTCESGYTRKSETGPCVEVGGLGAECESDADCLDELFPYCRVEDDGGYCTSPDCEEGSEACDTAIDYSCNTRESPAFCERPPEGLGIECADQKQCEGHAASFCEALVSKVCLPGGCKSDTSKCHGEWVCCDIPVLGDSICVPPSEIVDGKCPADGTLIARPK